MPKIIIQFSFLGMAELKVYDISAALTLSIMKIGHGLGARIVLRLLRKGSGLFKGSALMLDLPDLFKLLHISVFASALECSYVCNTINSCVPFYCTGKRSHPERWSYLIICGEATACTSFRLTRAEFTTLRTLECEIKRIVEIYDLSRDEKQALQCDTQPMD